MRSYEKNVSFSHWSQGWNGLRSKSVVVYSLCQHVNIGITSRRDPLNNEITPCRDITSRRDPLILRITLLSGSRRDVIPIFTFLHRLGKLVTLAVFEPMTIDFPNLFVVVVCWSIWETLWQTQTRDIQRLY